MISRPCALAIATKMDMKYMVNWNSIPYAAHPHISKVNGFTNGGHKQIHPHTHKMSTDVGEQEARAAHIHEQKMVRKTVEVTWSLLSSLTGTWSLMKEGGFSLCSLSSSCPIPPKPFTSFHLLF